MSIESPSKWIAADGQKFPEPGVIDVYCNIHPEMSATIVVLPNRRYVIAKADGTFAIEGVPTGSWSVFAYSRRAVHPVSVKVNVGATTSTPVQLDLDEVQREFKHENKFLTTANPVTGTPGKIRAFIANDAMGAQDRPFVGATATALAPLRGRAPGERRRDERRAPSRSSRRASARRSGDARSRVSSPRLVCPRRSPLAYRIDGVPEPPSILRKRGRSGPRGSRTIGTCVDSFFSPS